MKRFWISLMVLVLAMLCVVSCSKEAGDVAIQGGNEATTTAVPSEDATAAEQTLTLVADGKCHAVIVYPDGDTEVSSLGIKLRNEFQKTLSVRPDTEVDEYFDSDPNQIEILIGLTNRPESQKAKEELFRLDDYVCRREGNRILLMGLTAQATEKAVNYFMAKCLWNELTDGQLIYHDKTNRYYSAKYDVALASVDGTPLSQFTIVYPKGALHGEYYAALELRYMLYTKVRVDVAVMDDSQPVTGKEIRIGKLQGREAPNDVSEGSYWISVQDGNFCLNAVDLWGFVEGTAYMTDTLFAKGVASDTLNASYSYRAQTKETLQRSGEYRVMFHNVWAQGGNDPVLNRLDYAHALYASYLPDVFGMNEYMAGFRNQDVFLGVMRNYGYAEVPVGRSNGINGVPLFYRTDRLTLLDSRFVPFDDEQKGVTIALFADKNDSSKQFIVCCTHLSQNVGSFANGTERRRAHLKMFFNAIADFRQGRENVPVMLGGDYNARVSYDAGIYMREEGWKDSFDLAKIRNSASSMQGYPLIDEYFGYYVEPGYDGSLGAYIEAIDHVFWKGEGMEVSRYAILRNHFTCLIADHCPQLVEFNLQ